MTMRIMRSSLVRSLAFLLFLVASAGIVTPNTSVAMAASNFPIVGMAATTTGRGYWQVASDGGIFAYGDAGFYGSMGGKPLGSPIVGMAGRPTNFGYWLVGADGGVFAFGDAPFLGGMGGKPLSAPMVGMVATPTGKGYWLVGADGGVFGFGDAAFLGSMGGKDINAPMVGITATPSGKGYWLVGGDGGLFAYGDAGFHGSMGGQHLNKPMVGITRTKSGAGYWMVGADGGLFAFGDAGFYGSMGGKTLNGPMVGIASHASSTGYWMVASDGGIFAFGSSQYLGSMPYIGNPTQPQPRDTASTVVMHAKKENAKNVLETPLGSNCNPYTKALGGRDTQGCAAGTARTIWCADFARYVWGVAGAKTTGLSARAIDFYWYGKDFNTFKPSNPQPGDAVIFGDPKKIKTRANSTADHVGIVIAVYSPTHFVMIAGNDGKNTDRVQAVEVNTTKRAIIGYASPVAR